MGAMLIEHFSKRPDVAGIITIDKEPQPDLIKSVKNLTYIQANTNDGSWQNAVSAFAPDVVIHTAWQIRELYGKKEMQWGWNVEGSDAIFDFALSTPSVKKLIHFSTVASYGAYPTNTIEHRFTEAETFRKTDYLYAEEKRVAEEHLKEKFEKARKAGSKVEVAIVRPAAITGPRGRYMRIRFGLQSALSGQLKETFIHKLISLMVSFVPATAKWCRQFVHEDDVYNIIERLAFGNFPSEYEAYNLCPQGPVVTARDMASAVGKKILPVHPYLIRVVFFIFWHVSRGKVPTSRGGWKSYSYPIAVDGSKVTRLLGYQYLFQSKEAFTTIEGRYKEYAVSRASKK